LLYGIMKSHAMLTHPSTYPSARPQRTIMTANHLPYPKLRWKALDEIHAGEGGRI